MTAPAVQKQDADAARTEFEAGFIAEKQRLMGVQPCEESEKAIRAFHLTRASDDEYESLEARFAWWAWQASRRALLAPTTRKTTAYQCASCPCCGSTEIERTGLHLGAGDPLEWGVYEGFVECKDCHVSVAHTSRVSIEEAESSAVAAWNRRALLALDADLPAGPWSYRPHEFDDWGVVKDANGCVICQARDPRVLESDQLAAHRQAGTDPWGSVARFIVAARNAVIGERESNESA